MSPIQGTLYFYLLNLAPLSLWGAWAQCEHRDEPQSPAVGPLVSRVPKADLHGTCSWLARCSNTFLAGSVFPQLVWIVLLSLAIQRVQLIAVVICQCITNPPQFCGVKQKPSYYACGFHGAWIRTDYRGHSLFLLHSVWGLLWDANSQDWHK